MVPSMRQLQNHNKTSWFCIRKDLSPLRKTFLGIFSFILPIGIWCLFSYVPTIWHPDIRLTIAAEQEGSSTVFIPGNHLSKEHFGRFVNAIQEDNLKTNKLYQDSDKNLPPARLVQRQNQRILRQLGHIAYLNNFISREQRQDDEQLLEVWRGLANGDLQDKRYPLTAENHRILKQNWELLTHIETFSTNALPEIPLLKLLPQGVAANPVFLPAPHEVILTGIRIFKIEPTGDTPRMTARLKHSLYIVFSGFLIACLIGVPLGLLCGTYDLCSSLFEPFIDFFRYLPAPVFSTLLVAILGAHDAPKIALIFIGTFFQMVLMLAKTTRMLDRSLIEAAQTLGANSRQLLSKVIVPGVLPNIYNDLRILLGWAWTWLVIAELIGVKTGLTEFIETQGRWRNFDQVYPIIITIGLIGFSTDQILLYLRRFFFPWEPKGRRLSMRWLTQNYIRN
jgi:NitT/TauT family transport system permease protein